METEDDTEKDTYEKTDKAIEICKERETNAQRQAWNRRRHRYRLTRTRK